MKRLVDLQAQCNYIYDCYSRYKGDNIDVTTAHTCFDILNWMSKEDQFNNVVYAAYEEKKGKNYADIIGQQGRKELVQKLFKDKSIRYRRKTLDRCLTLLLEDMYIEE